MRSLFILILLSDAMDIANVIITIVMTTHGRKIQSSTFLLLD